MGLGLLIGKIYTREISALGNLQKQPLLRTSSRVGHLSYALVPYCQQLTLLYF